MDSLLFSRSNLFVDIIRNDPSIDTHLLVARLCENNIFDRRAAILWCRNRKFYYKKSLVRLSTPSKQDNSERRTSRKFLSRFREMILIFGAYLPPFEQTEGVSRELYDAMIVLQKYDHLVRVIDIGEDWIVLTFPNIYDMIIHRMSFGKNIDFRSRFRFWSDHKYQILSPISNILDGNFIKRKFTFPLQLINHEAFRALSIENYNATIRHLIANFLLRYIKELSNFDKDDMIKDLDSNRLFLHFSQKYEQHLIVFEDVLKKILKEWNEYTL